MYSNGKNILCEQSRLLKTVDVFSNNVTASRNVSKDYYVSEFVIEAKDVVIVMCVKKNQIDIFSLKDLSLIESVNRKGSKKFIREKCVIDEEKENIYYVTCHGIGRCRA